MRVDQPKLEAKIREFTELVPLPETGIRIQEMVAEPDPDVARITGLIEADPALAARLLRCANSAYFGLSREVDSIHHAVMMVGVDYVADLVSAIAASQLYTGSDRQSVVDCKKIWLHSICVAEAARLVSQYASVNAQLAYLAGLLHEVGVPALAYASGRKYKRVLEHTDRAGISLHAAEQEILGVDHAWAAGVLFDHWKLPRRLVEPAAFHHSSEPHDNVLVSLVQVGDTLATLEGLAEPSGEVLKPEFSHSSAAALHLQDEDFDRLGVDLHGRRDAMEAVYRETLRTPSSSVAATA